MRNGVGLGTLLLALALGLPLLAQEPASSFLTGVRPNQIQYDKTSYKQMAQAFTGTSQVITAPNIQRTLNPSSSFLSKIPALPKVSLPSWVPLIGSKAPTRPVPVARQPRRPRVQTVGQ